MPELFLAKRADSLLEAVDDDTLDLLTTGKAGSVFSCSFKVARNPANHRRWFKFVTVSFDMQDQYEDKEIWRKVLQMLAGHFDTVTDAKGNTHYWPKSISFKEIDDEKVFQDLFKRAVSAFLGRYGGGMSEADFMQVLRIWLSTVSHSQIRS